MSYIATHGFMFKQHEKIKLEKEHMDLPHNCYHEFSCNEIDMREYHIDTHPILKELTPPGMHQYGVNISVCFDQNTRPLMMIGQYKSATFLLQNCRLLCLNPST